MKAFWIIIGILFVVFLLNTYFLRRGGKSKLYCWLFMRDDWNVWEKIIKSFDGIKFIEHNVFEDKPWLDAYLFELLIDGEPYELIYWEKNGFVSVHGGTEDTKKICLSDFDKYHNGVAKNMLRKKFDFIE